MRQMVAGRKMRQGNETHLCDKGMGGRVLSCAELVQRHRTGTHSWASI